MPPEIVTALVAELDGRHGPMAADQVQEVARRAGAVDVDVTTSADGCRLIAAEFHSVGDSTRAAIEVARALTGRVVGPEPGRVDGVDGVDGVGDPEPGEAVPGLRMALCTGTFATLGGPGSTSCPRTWATDLVAWAEPGRVLATEATVIVTGGGLPPGVDLVDRGSRRLAPGRKPERIYELRIDVGDPGDRPGRDAPGDAGAGRSNLEWARRAVGGVDETAHDLDGVLDSLTASWRAAQGDGRRTVLMSSIGSACKTRVAAELALRLDAEGALVLYGRWDRDVSAPYQGIREAFGVYADDHGVERLRADLEGWGDEIARLLPDVAARLGWTGAGGATPHGPTGGAPGDERGRLFDAVEAWIAALAGRRPTLLVLDDVTWAEASSLLLIEHLHHAGAGIPLLILVAFSTGDALAAGPLCSSDATGTPPVLTHAHAAEVGRVDLDT